MADPIYPCIWFDGKAKRAAAFYCSIFPESRITSENPMVVHFELNGRAMMGLNGGPMFKPNEAVSFVISCSDQSEIDFYWNALTENGQESQCGWLKGQFGVSWQVVPTLLSDLLADPEKAPAVTAAFLKMKKFDIETLLNA